MNRNYLIEEITALKFFQSQGRLFPLGVEFVQFLGKLGDFCLNSLCPRGQPCERGGLFCAIIPRAGRKGQNETSPVSETAMTDLQFEQRKRPLFVADSRFSQIGQRMESGNISFFTLSSPRRK